MNLFTLFIFVIVWNVSIVLPVYMLWNMPVTLIDEYKIEKLLAGLWGMLWVMSMLVLFT